MMRELLILMVGDDNDVWQTHLHDFSSENQMITCNKLNMSFSSSGVLRIQCGDEQLRALCSLVSPRMGNQLPGEDFRYIVLSQ